MKKIRIILIKIFKRIKSKFTILKYKLLYLNEFKIGKRTVLYSNNSFVIDQEGKITIGDNCFFNRNCSINSLKSITIGNNCIFGENVLIYDHNHKFSNKNELIKNQGYKCKEIKIGNNCWICSNVVILSGIEIGDNCVIGACCVINKNIPSNSIVRCDSNNIIIEERR